MKKIHVLLFALVIITCAFTQKGNPQELYKNCENIYQYEYKKAKDLRFEAVNASVVREDSKGQLLIIPEENANTVKLEVYKGKKLIATQEFKVVTAPEPNFYLTKNNSEVNLKDGLSLEECAGADKLGVKASPLAKMTLQAPKDTRFRAEKYDITLARGKQAIKTISISKGEEVPFSTFIEMAEAGDRLVIEINQVSRLNYTNQVTFNDQESMVLMTVELY